MYKNFNQENYPHSYPLDQAIQTQMKLYLLGEITIAEFHTSFIKLYALLDTAHEIERENDSVSTSKKPTPRC
jgi:hypothetical protein